MKKVLIIALIFILVASVIGIVACNNNNTVVAFDKTEYELSDGDRAFIESKKNVTYKLLTTLDGVSVNEANGRFTVDSSVADYSQVVLAAVVDGKVVSTAICCLRTVTQDPAITFSNLSNYLVNGEVVTAVSDPLCSITYSLLQEYAGITIDSVNGKVTFSGNVADGEQFTVVASARGVSGTKTFTTAVGNYVVAQNAKSISEYRVGTDASFTIDYKDNPEAEQSGVLAVMRGNTRLSLDDWSYDRDTRTVTIKSSYNASLSMGDNVFKVVTAKNTVSVTVNVATYIATAAELAAINGSREALGGNYIMVCDVDLTDYLSLNGKGYNNGKGWTPIGTYFDTHVGAETDWAFTGTFDGNGHTINGFFINRSDDYAYNSGLFGYVSSQATIRNLGVRNGEGKVNNVRSYSGGFVGVNVGTITDCWADVDVITGEAFKVVGGFVGRNEGQIVNCYSLGRVVAGSEVGCFAGVSRTPISLGTQANCYALKTENYAFSNDYDDTCKLIATKSELSDCDFTAYSQAWNVQAGSIPTLKSIPVNYSLRELNVTADKKYATLMEQFSLSVTTNPINPNYKFAYEIVEGRGVQISPNGEINTSNVQFGDSAEPIRCVVKVACENLSVLYEFYVYNKVHGISFDANMETTIYAGGYYKVDTVVDPITANQQVKYSLVKGLYGVTLSDDGIIAVSENIVSDNDEIIVKATAVDGQSCQLAIKVVANKQFDNNYKIIYRGQTSKVEFTLPTGVIASDIVKVTRFDKEIPYQAQGGALSMDSEYFADFNNREIPLKLITNDAVYKAFVVAYNRADVLEIGSVADFMQYKADFKTDPTVRSKVVILTADLDFDGAEITSIGSHHLEEDFLGVFNGNGHTISNLTINRNDFSEADTSFDRNENNYPYHASRYNVGLFSFVKGIVTNVHFVNVTVANTFSGSFITETGTQLTFENEAIGNFIGIVAGTVEGTVSNCTFDNCVVKGGDLKGIVCGKDTAVIVTNCFINGKLTEKTN